METLPTGIIAYSMSLKISELVCNAAIRAQIQKYECSLVQGIIHFTFNLSLRLTGFLSAIPFAPPRECFSISVELRLHEGSILARGLNNTSPAVYIKWYIEERE